MIIRNESKQSILHCIDCPSVYVWHCAAVSGRPWPLTVILDKTFKSDEPTIHVAAMSGHECGVELVKSKSPNKIHVAWLIDELKWISAAELKLTQKQSINTYTIIIMTQHTLKNNHQRVHQVMELHKFLTQFNENHSFQEITRECHYSSPNTSSLGDKTMIKRATRKASQLDILKQPATA